MASFQAKPRQDRLRMREKKIVVSIYSNSTRNREFKKKRKKIQKIKNHHYGFFSTQNGSVVAKKERKKKFSFQSVRTRLEMQNSKKKRKKFKKLKNIIMASFQAKPERDWLRMRLKKKKNIIPINSNPTQKREFQQNR